MGTFTLRKPIVNTRLPKNTLLIIEFCELIAPSKDQAIYYKSFIQSLVFTVPVF
ncbi:hypothetical protein PanWU01x14_135210 [Parasponia andersonii]|uniref:Uncharacterized protein n=1 Tax=Parasponia andersonii TaxID=3476 RepID=A0A2P5CPA4_PARAD|nr:hypothetical protein PanWU01x14_135210 [Parasponia andersonii]